MTLNGKSQSTERGSAPEVFREAMMWFLILAVVLPYVNGFTVTSVCAQETAHMTYADGIDDMWRDLAKYYTDRKSLIRGASDMPWVFPISDAVFLERPIVVKGGIVTKFPELLLSYEKDDKLHFATSDSTHFAVDVREIETASEVEDAVVYARTSNGIRLAAIPAKPLKIALRELRFGATDGSEAGITGIVAVFDIRFFDVWSDEAVRKQEELLARAVKTLGEHEAGIATVRVDFVTGYSEETFYRDSPLRGNSHPFRCRDLPWMLEVMAEDKNLVVHAGSRGTVHSVERTEAGLTVMVGLAEGMHAYEGLEVAFVERGQVVAKGTKIGLDDRKPLSGDLERTRMRVSSTEKTDRRISIGDRRNTTLHLSRTLLPDSRDSLIALFRSELYPAVDSFEPNTLTIFDACMFELAADGKSQVFQTSDDSTSARAMRAYLNLRGRGMREAREAETTSFELRLGLGDLAEAAKAMVAYLDVDAGRMELATSEKTVMVIRIDEIERAPDGQDALLRLTDSNGRVLATPAKTLRWALKRLRLGPDNGAVIMVDNTFPSYIRGYSSVMHRVWGAVGIRQRGSRTFRVKPGRPMHGFFRERAIGESRGGQYIDTYRMIRAMALDREFVCHEGEAGKVVSVEDGREGFTVTIESNGVLPSVYAGLEGVIVEEGQAIKNGDLIGADNEENGRRLLNHTRGIGGFKAD